MLDRKRLYISPLNPDILTLILPPPLQEQAANISYHTIQTFPEKSYGYIELAAAEADRLRKKLHGSTLKGLKLRLEEARPAMVKTRANESRSEEGMESVQGRTQKQRKSRTKSEDGVLPGVELPPDRKVQRGWTEPEMRKPRRSKRTERSEMKKKNKKTGKPSAYTEGAECLFKTKAPANAVKMSTDSSEGRSRKKRKRGESERNILVHEFENNTKHASFLRDRQNLTESNPTSKFIKGRGWIDGDSNVIEEEPKTRNAKMLTHRSRDVQTARVKKKPAERDKREVPPAKNSNQPEHFSEETSSSGDSSDPESENVPRDENKLSEALKRASKDISKGQKLEAGQQKDTEDGIGTAQVRALSISWSSPTPPLQPSSFKSSHELHPLEALFKRPTNAASQTPKKPSLEVRTSFNFFEPDTDESSNTKLAIPQTPFTQQDYQRRRMRSAAPTPDTAAPGRATFGHVWSQGSDIPDEEDEDGEPGTDTPVESRDMVKEEEKQESDFQKWFWEHRGENNRAWKRRRREAAKEKRQRDNKKRS
ncbi:MAG: hypothetical protein LQ351_007117 [Letrouitia transgressa]|nr:MAG: hypothetical protein LQ351_007117 [Letrouitia transgressa]